LAELLVTCAAGAADDAAAGGTAFDPDSNSATEAFCLASAGAGCVGGGAVTAGDGVAFAEFDGGAFEGELPHATMSIVMKLQHANHAIGKRFLADMDDSPVLFSHTS
jgi:hypothetical protein